VQSRGAMGAAELFKPSPAGRYRRGGSGGRREMRRRFGGRPESGTVRSTTARRWLSRTEVRWGPRFSSTGPAQEPPLLLPQIFLLGPARPASRVRRGFGDWTVTQHKGTTLRCTTRYQQWNQYVARPSPDHSQTHVRDGRGQRRAHIFHNFREIYKFLGILVRKGCFNVPIRGE